MSLKDFAGFNNRFSAGRATAGTTYTTINENVQVLGNMSVIQSLTTDGNLVSQGNISAIGGLSVSGVSTFTNPIHSSSSVYLNNLNINSGKLTVDSVGNVKSLGTLEVAGDATLSSSVNVQSGKFVIDSTGNVGIGNAPSGAVMDIYNNNSRIRLRGTGTGIEWNNTGSAVLSSMIYDTDGGLKMYSSSTQNPKIRMDTNNVIMISDPTSSVLTSARHTGITPVGILTVSGIYTINLTQAGPQMTVSGTDSDALFSHLNANKAYLYIDHASYRNKLLFPTITGTKVVTLVDVITGGAVTVDITAENVKLYAASSAVSNSGKFHSASLVTPDNNPRVVVSNQYGQLSLSE